VTKEFCALNRLECVARSHQLVDEGYKYYFDKTLVTVWSAPNYCYRCGNKAAILELNEQHEHAFKVFDAIPNEPHMIPARPLVPYFL
jgi:hypothetical protein